MSGNSYYFVVMGNEFKLSTTAVELQQIQVHKSFLTLYELNRTGSLAYYTKRYACQILEKTCFNIHEKIQLRKKNVLSWQHLPPHIKCLSIVIHIVFLTSQTNTEQNCNGAEQLPRTPSQSNPQMIVITTILNSSFNAKLGPIEQFILLLL